MNIDQATGNALLKNICINPYDDAPRLIYADWLEENGKERQANNIRWGVANPKVCTRKFPIVCHDGKITNYYKYRGFESEVSCALSYFIEVSEFVVFKNPITKWILTDFNPRKNFIFSKFYWTEKDKRRLYYYDGQLPIELSKFLKGDCDNIFGAFQYDNNTLLLEDVEQACYHYARQKLLKGVKL